MQAIKLCNLGTFRITFSFLNNRLIISIQIMNQFSYFAIRGNMNSRIIYVNRDNRADALGVLVTESLLVHT